MQVREAVLNKLKNGDWAVWQLSFDQDEAKLIRWLLENNFLTAADIAQAVHEGICAIGRRDYAWHMRNQRQNYPDHGDSPRGLGYAIKHGAISEEEARLIIFDHGETLETFTRESDGYLEEVIRDLAKQTEVPQPAITVSDYCDCPICIR